MGHVVIQTHTQTCKGTSGASAPCPPPHSPMVGSSPRPGRLGGQRETGVGGALSDPFRSWWPVLDAELPTLGGQSQDMQIQGAQLN